MIRNLLDTQNSSLDNRLLAIKDAMTLEQKVGQLIMAFFYGDTICNAVEDHLKETMIGNIIFFPWANNLSSHEQIGKLSEKLHDRISAFTGLPPLFGIDQEGGYVHRLMDGGFTHFPSQMALSATGDLSLARQMGLAIGLELLSAGLNFNLSPVVDVYQGKPTINVRSFGSSPSTVAAFADALTDGLLESGILFAVKHSPGYGDVASDPHSHRCFSHKPLAELKQTDFIPFAKLSPKAPAMMTAHLVSSSLDPDHIATFSEKIIQGLIRKEWNFQGMVISDSLTMNAALENTATYQEAVSSVKKASLKAILAGCDMLILGKLEWTGFSPTKEQDYLLVKEVAAFLVREVKMGAIPLARIDDALLKILHMKKRFLGNKFTYQKEDKSHIPLAKEIAKKGLTLISSLDLLRELNTEDLILLFPKELEAFLAKTGISLPTSLIPSDPSEEIVQEVEEAAAHAAKKGKVCVFFSCNAHLFPRQLALISRLRDLLGAKNLVFVGLKNPYDLIDLGVHKTHTTYLTYSSDPFSLECVIRSLQNKEVPSGKLPATT